PAPTTAPAAAPTTAPAAAPTTVPGAVAPGSPAPAPAAAAPKAAAAVTLKQMSWTQAIGDVAMPTLAKSFAARTNGAISVEITSLGFNDYWSKLTTLFSAGQPPDAAWEHTAYINAHQKLGV